MTLIVIKGQREITRWDFQPPKPGSMVKVNLLVFVKIKVVPLTDATVLFLAESECQGKLFFQCDLDTIFGNLRVL
jgi:hypothetical protein